MDIADAWQLVEWMRERGWEYAIYSVSQGVGIVFHRFTEDEDRGATAETAPLAIVSAFLAANEVK